MSDSETISELAARLLSAKEARIAELEAQLAERTKEKEHWYQRFVKLETTQATCCVSNADQLSAIRAALSAGPEEDLVEAARKVAAERDEYRSTAMNAINDLAERCRLIGGTLAALHVGPHPDRLIEAAQRMKAERDDAFTFLRCARNWIKAGLTPAQGEVFDAVLAKAGV